jgi:hypothetical protein
MQAAVMPVSMNESPKDTKIAVSEGIGTPPGESLGKPAGSFAIT